MEIIKMYEYKFLFVVEMQYPIRFFLSDHTNMVLAPCHKGNQEENGGLVVALFWL